MSPESGPSLNAADRQLRWTLFAAFACLYLFFAAGHFTAADAWQKFLALKALLIDGTVFFKDGWSPGIGGACAYYPLGSSLLMLPGWLIGTALTPLAPQVPADFVARFAISLQNAFISAGLVTAVYACARSLGYRVQAALYAAGALGLGSMVFAYAKSDWSEPACALFLFGASALLLRASEDGLRDWKPIAGAGALLAAVVAVRNETALIAPGALAWLAWRHRTAPVALGRAIALMLPSIAVTAAMTMWYNAARYGHAIAFHHWGVVKDVAPPPEGGPILWALNNLWHYTLNPGDGMLWFSPVVLAGLAGFPTFWRRHRSMATLMLVGVLPLYCFYWGLWGLSDWAWGLRYSYVFLPFILLPAACAWDALPKARPLWLGLLGVGLLVQLLGILHNYGYLYEREQARATEPLTIQLLMAKPAHAPLLLAVREAPAVVAGGVQLLLAAPPATNPSPAEARVQAAFVPDVWWLLLLLTTFPRWLTLGVAALLLAALAFLTGRVRALAGRVAATEAGAAGM